MSLFLSLLLSITLLLAHLTSPIKAAVFYTRRYYYIGGSYTTTSKGQHFLENQLYVEILTPDGGATKPYPLVFLQGVGQSGTNWQNKPDNLPGWSYFFLSLGYECYLIDHPASGRSPYLPPSPSLPSHKPPQTQLSAEFVENWYTAPQNRDTYPDAHLHTQWNGTGLRGDPIFDMFYSGILPAVRDEVGFQRVGTDAGVKLLERIGKKVILISHAEGATLSLLLADRRPGLVERIVMLEPEGPPFGGAVGEKGRKWGVADVEIGYEPAVKSPERELVKAVVKGEEGKGVCVLQAERPVPRKLVNLVGKDVLVLTGEASWHVGFDWCTVRFLQQAGVNASHVLLSERGVHGNGHFSMLEMNSQVIAEVVRVWIES